MIISAKRQIETPALTVTLDQLEQGTYYDFSIQPFYQVNMQYWPVAFSLATPGTQDFGMKNKLPKLTTTAVWHNK